MSAGSRRAAGSPTASPATLVGGDVGDEVTRPLRERHVVVHIGGDAHAGEHLVAEAVRGGDGGGVEVRRCGGQASSAQLRLAIVALSQVTDEVVGRTACRVEVIQACRRLDESLADTLTKLGGGCAAERDEHELVDAGNALGEVANGKTGDGVGLARTGTGLEHGRALGQRPAQVEDRRCARHLSRFTSASSSGDHTRRASCPNRWGSSG
jgi:hypothetical protein